MWSVGMLNLIVAVNNSDKNHMYCIIKSRSLKWTDKKFCEQARLTKTFFLNQGSWPWWIHFNEIKVWGQQGLVRDLDVGFSARHLNRCVSVSTASAVSFLMWIHCVLVAGVKDLSKIVNHFVYKLCVPGKHNSYRSKENWIMANWLTDKGFI